MMLCDACPRVGPTGRQLFSKTPKVRAQRSRSGERIHDAGCCGAFRDVIHHLGALSPARVQERVSTQICSRPLARRGTRRSGAWRFASTACSHLGPVSAAYSRAQSRRPAGIATHSRDRHDHDPRRWNGGDGQGTGTRNKIPDWGEACCGQLAERPRSCARRPRRMCHSPRKQAGETSYGSGQRRRAAPLLLFSRGPASGVPQK
jgi:hypothetical protein